MHISFKSQDTEASLTVEGDLGIAGASEFHEALRHLFAGPADLRLDLTGVTGCDATALQLLFAARRTARESGRRLELAGLAAVEAACATLGLNAQNLAEETAHGA